MSRIKSGTILRFELPFGFGVGYAKLLDFTEISQFYGFIIKVYDYFEEGFSGGVDFFKDIPLFMNEIPICKMPTLRGKGSWQAIGVLNEKTDGEIPFFKEGVHEGFALETLAEYQNRDWNALKNLREDIGPVPFNKVRHLEEPFLRSTSTVENRIVMQLLRYQEEDVYDFFKKNAETHAWETDYRTQQFIPLYKTIPAEIRGRPLIKGYVPDQYLDREGGE